MIQHSAAIAAAIVVAVSSVLAAHAQQPAPVQPQVFVPQQQEDEKTLGVGQVDPSERVQVQPPEPLKPEIDLDKQQPDPVPKPFRR